MNKVQLRFIFWLFCLTGDSVLSTKVRQIPSDQILSRGDSVEFRCLHSIENYNVILWYKKRVNHTLELMGHLWNKKDYVEPNFTEKIEIKGDANSNGSLIIKKLSSDDRAAGASDVIQPKTVWAEVGESATINCSHTKGVDYKQMYWFRQHQGESLELIVFATSYGSPDFGKFDPNKFSANKPNPESGSFTVNDVDYSDSAVYFCAVSKHSVITTGRRCTKTRNLHEGQIQKYQLGAV
ncbi:Immunoglobulin iota chain [Clarias magur]|nr:Immunoglobulin iota chain [Clarias magur]